MASKKNGTLYIGVTNNIARRVYEHKNNLIEGFSKNYQTHLLVYVEQTSTVTEALNREKQIKHWNRKWKMRIIEEQNPNWIDLADKY